MASATTRVFRATNTSAAAIKLSETGIFLASGDKTGIVVMKGRGTNIIGPQNWVSSGDTRRLAGMWVHQMELIDMIPETIVTPFPNIILMPPVAGLATLAEDLSFFAAMLG